MQQNNSIPFISYDKKSGFIITEEAENFLLTLNPERKIGLVSIVGKYRTGKSFFINRVLLNKKSQGFTVGHTINACTKGIWLWNSVISPGEDSEHKDMDILLLDTEGFGDTEENVNHDSRIFLFSLLLCSFFIYNSVGNIDENALNGVSLIINLAKNIQVKNSVGVEQGDDPANYFPSFLWVVRDFALKLEDKDGKNLKDKDYLEKALEEQKGVSDAIDSKNRLRRLFKKFFKDRDCCTLVRPLEKEEDLRKLNELDDEDFRPEFTKQLKNIRKKIFKKINPKVLNGKTFNAEMLLELTKAYIKALNSGSLPNIESAWQYLVKNESKKAMLTAVDLVEKEISEFIKSPHPQDLESVKSIKSKLQSQLISSFRRKAIGDHEDIQTMMDDLNQDFKSKFKKVKESNLANWKRKYLEFTQTKYYEIEDRLKIGNYSSYFEFQNDFNKLKEDFEKNGPVGPNKEEFFKDLSENLHNLAAEHISRKSEIIFSEESRKLLIKLELLEKEFYDKRIHWDNEKAIYEKKISDLEREKLLKETSLETYDEKYKKLKDENMKLKNNEEKLIISLKEKEKENIDNFEKYKHTIEQKFEHIKNEHNTKIIELEKIKGLKEKENYDISKEKDSIVKRLINLEEEKQSLEKTIKTLTKTQKSLEKSLMDSNDNKQKEISALKLEYELKLKEASTHKEITVENKMQLNEVLIRNSYLESQVKQLEIQLVESRRIYDTLLLTLQSGFESKENKNSDSRELLSINKNLSLTVEGFENRLKLHELKIKKLKNFKKIVKQSSAFRCRKCSEFFNANLFNDHIVVCRKLPSSATNASSNFNNNKNQDIEILKTVSEISSRNSEKPLKQSQIIEHFNNKDNNIDKISPFKLKQETLKINIRQTNIQTNEDQKLYTEYMIFCNYNNIKWKISKTYTQFCQLYQELILIYPYIAVKNSDFLKNFTKTKGFFEADKSLCLEEKRKELEYFLRDISENESIRSNQIFRKFLNIDKALTNFGSNDYIDISPNKRSLAIGFGSDSKGKIGEILAKETISPISSINNKQALYSISQNNENHSDKNSSETGSEEN